MILKKSILILLGFIFLGLGMIGIILPLVPTTPFLILASLCFVRGSSRMNTWLLNHRVFGNYLRNYLDEKAIKKEARIRTMFFLWSTLLISIFLIDLTVIKIILVIIGATVSLHLMALKTI
ncbi:MAG: YbaN family protein [Clostridiales bacterium]|nr:YbaN family protein [Clostridiales bacterium]